MKRIKKIYLIILLIMLCFSFIVIFYDVLFDDKIKTYQISVIYSGKSTESFTVIKEGAEQAATEMNANIRFIFLSKENNEEEQIELIKRESRNQVDAIIISPIETERVIDTIEEVSKNIPVVIIQSVVKTERNIHKISSNEYELGKLLAKDVLEKNNDDKEVMIMISDFHTISTDERYNGVIDELNKSEKKYLISKIENYQDNKNCTSMKKFLNNDDIGAIICLDSNISEYISEIKKTFIQTEEDKENDILIFTVGNTNKIISFLDEGIIEATAVLNEFNIGYIGVQDAITIINKGKVAEKKLQTTIINSDEMYLKEYERILFQFIR